MSRKEELRERFLYFNPQIIFDGSVGGVELLMEVDAFNNHIYWTVREGHLYTEFDDFEEALDYYLENGGEEEC